MNFILTNHAKKRMIERGITIEEINTVVENPDYTIKKDNFIESFKRLNNKILKIVYMEGKFIKIITVIEL
ncbi:MAG: DUF4258 domain-containing protein [Candidatus Pacearchaeota archaeon]|jgi:hypothetical protein